MNKYEQWVANGIIFSIPLMSVNAIAERIGGCDDLINPCRSDLPNPSDSHVPTHIVTPFHISSGVSGTFETIL